MINRIGQVWEVDTGLIVLIWKSVWTPPGNDMNGHFDLPHNGINEHYLTVIRQAKDYTDNDVVWLEDLMLFEEHSDLTRLI